MKKLLCTFGLIGILLGYSAAGWATTYNEADSGDLDMYGLTSIGALELGINQILGNIHLDMADPGRSNDLDAFTFTLPADLIITSATISFTTDYDNANTNSGLVAKA